MATYPNGLVAFPVHSAKNEYPKSADRNAPNREIEAICTELGTNPRSISDSVTPTATPASVAVALDMFATILKSMRGAGNWHSAGAAIRRVIGGGGNGTTVAATTTNYHGMGFHALGATEADHVMVAPYDGTIETGYVTTLTAQPGTGTLQFFFRINGVDVDASPSFSVAAGGAAGSHSGNGVSAQFRKGDKISLRIRNNASSASAQIGPWAVQLFQTG